jgi:hypothetical protein
MKITESQLRQILEEEYDNVIYLAEVQRRRILIEQAEEVIENEVAVAEDESNKYGLQFIDWNSTLTAIGGSLVPFIMKTFGGPIGVSAGLGLDGAIFVKAVYEFIQAKRSGIALEKLLFDITGEYGGLPGTYSPLPMPVPSPQLVTAAGTAYFKGLDRPLSAEALEMLRNLPQEEKDKIGTLMARHFQYLRRGIVSLISSMPDDVFSGPAAVLGGIAPIEEVIISGAELGAELMGSFPGLLDLLRKDNFVSKLIFTVLNRVTLTNMGLVGSAIGMLDPTKLERLGAAPELEGYKKTKTGRYQVDRPEEEEEEVPPRALIGAEEETALEQGV